VKSVRSEATAVTCVLRWTKWTTSKSAPGTNRCSFSPSVLTSCPNLCSVASGRMNYDLRITHAQMKGCKILLVFMFYGFEAIFNSRNDFSHKGTFVLILNIIIITNLTWTSGLLSHSFRATPRISLFGILCANNKSQPANPNLDFLKPFS